MRNNLKTFPYAQTAGNMEAWVRQLEREVRKMIEKEEKNQYFAIVEVLKEILGDA